VPVVAVVVVDAAPAPVEVFRSRVTCFALHFDEGGVLGDVAFPSCPHFVGEHVPGALQQSVE
jgi:hypothetical protein